MSQFSWVLYLFGAFLIITGIKMWFIADHAPDIANNPLLKFLKRHVRVTKGLRGNGAMAALPSLATIFLGLGLGARLGRATGRG